MTAVTLERRSGHAAAQRWADIRLSVRDRAVIGGKVQANADRI